MSQFRGRRIITSLLLSSLTALLVACGGASSEELLSDAIAAQQQGDSRTAGIHLKNLLQDDPDNAEARFRLGEVSLEMGDVASAEKEFERALSLGVDPARVRVPLLETRLGLRMYEQVIDDADPDLAADDEERVAILLALGAGYQGVGSAADAEQAYRQALQLAPGSAEGHARLAQLLVAIGELAEADQLIAAGLGLVPDDRPLLLLKATRQAMEADFEAAEATLLRVLELVDDDQGGEQFLALSQLTEVRLARNDGEGALESVQSLLDTRPENIIARYLRARVAAQQSDLNLASDMLQTLVSEAPGYRPAQRLLGALHSIQGNLGQAEMYLSQVVGAAPGDDFARRLLAEVRLRQDRPEEAMAALLPAIDGDTSGGMFLALAGQASLQAGKRDEAIQYFQRGVAADPENIRLRLGTASAFLASGEIERAISLLESLPEGQGPNAGGDYLLVLAHLKKGDFASALGIAQTLQEQNPEAAWPHNLLGSVRFVAEDYPEARAAFEKTLAGDPDNIAALSNLVRLELRVGDRDAAGEQLQRILEVDAANVRAMLTLAQIDLSAGRRGGAKTWLRKASEADESAFSPRFSLAGLLLEDGDAAEARVVAEQAVASNPQRADAHNLLGIAALGSGDVEQALESLRRAVEIDAPNPLYHLNLARAQLAARDSRSTLESLLEIRRLDGGYELPTRVIALVDVGAADPGSVSRLLEDLRANSPESSARYMLEADVLMSERRHEEAASLYADLYAREPGQVAAFRAYRARRLAALSDAPRELRQWSASNPDDGNAGFALGSAEQELGNQAAAISEYERVVAGNPRHAGAWNNLAWLYHMQNDERALDTARQAYDLVPQNPMIIDTLGWLHVEGGDLERGLTLLKQASEQLSGELEIRYHLASALAKSGDAEEAKRLLTKILGSDSEFDSRQDASALLERL